MALKENPSNIYDTFRDTFNDSVALESSLTLPVSGGGGDPGRFLGNENPLDR